jgi:hypothetical protein
MQYWKNKYASCRGISFTNAVAKGTTIGLLLTGNAFGTQSNNLTFENCSWSGFDNGLQAGESGGQAASELLFLNCSFEQNNNGFVGASTGNTINLWFFGCAYSQNTEYGADFGTAQMPVVVGGATHGNGIATFRCTSSWQQTVKIDALRFELTPPELAVELGNGTSIEVSNCLFVTTSTVPTYPILSGGSPNCMTLVNNTVGTLGNVGWILCGDMQGGPTKFLEMVGNYIYGTDAFYINPGGSGTDGLRYNLRGNTYGGVQHGTEIGRVVWPNRVPDNDQGTVNLSSGQATVSFSANRDTNYALALSVGSSVFVWRAAASSTGFSVNASNTASTALVHWQLQRIST